ncbi:GAF domain-containing protein [Pantanalinema rosaneae CENA516]|uniref:GAF domain-containing protein n=1 Tax=Pantanalinema rosaneae TaxID=1620701 RepID=UPI003D6F46C6
MTAPSSHLPEQNQRDSVTEVSHKTVKMTGGQSVSSIQTVDVDVVIDTQPERSSSPEPTRRHDSGRGGALVNSTGEKGSFSSFLAPLKKDTFKEVVSDVEDKLKVVNQTLSMLDMQGFDAVLEEMLSSITFKTGELLNADRATIFLIDEEKNELYTTIAQGKGGGTVEIRIPADKGIAGEVATWKRVVNIAYDFYDDPRSGAAKELDKKNNYRTYTMLAMPLLNEEGALVAVVQLINKLKPKSDPTAPLDEKIDLAGFTSDDEDVFREFAPSIRLILESSKSFYVATQKQRAANALIKATESLSKSSLDLDETLKRVMEEAKQLMNADRSTLWLIDRDRNEIWTKIVIADGSLKELRIPIGVGFAGQAAASGEVLNIPFDLYELEGAETAKKTDQSSGYRTCSLLCMPVLADGELIGVTQLVNKKKQGEYPPYDPANWPHAPECWKASFNRSDQEFMEAFNIQAGVALKNAKLFQTVKQQEQMQRDILRSLSNGVISTDQNGNIIAANESAKKLLGLEETDPLETQPVRELIQLEKSDFSRWFNMALEARDDKSRHQYYPDQTLQSVKGIEQHSINLSINTISDANDMTKVSGALVVMEDVSAEKRLKNTMSRYMSEAVAKQLFENPDAAKMGGDRKKVSVLFSDIRSYTTITESLTAEEVVEMLNKYFESMVDAVFTYEGTLDKYIGDAIMAVFGSPLPLEDHEWKAVQTAIAMRHRLAAFNEERIRQNYAPIRIGIGINSDEVISGNIGSSKRMEFTAIGDGVNLGSRLESASKQYGTDIVISENTYKPCADRVWVRELDYIKVKGKTKPVAIYELVELKSVDIGSELKQKIQLYHAGLHYYRDRKFRKALNEFAAILEDIDSQDKAALLHMDRCQYWLQNPPTDDWDGSWALTEK